MNVAHLLDRSARTFPGRPALFHGTRLLCDYRGLARRASGLGGALRQKLGLQPGERVAVLSRNHPCYLEIRQGTWYAGLVVVPINSKLHPREVEYILLHSGARVLFTSADLAAELQLQAAQLPALRATLDIDSADYKALLAGEPIPIESRLPQDVAWLFYTSGTTGRPKGVMQTHRNLMSMTLCYFSDVDAIDPGDASLYAAPMSHGAGLYTLPHVLAGARHVVPESGGFDPDEIARLARVLRGISMFAAPTMVKRMVEHAKATGGHGDGTGDGIKTVVYGGGPIYGTGIKDALHPRHAQRLVSVGVAQSHVEVRVVHPDGQPLAPGESSEIVVRGDTVMAGYWQDEAASSSALAGGWLRTGDVGEMDSDGFLTLRDRSKDLIISGGSNIYPREVEEVLLRHPAVQEVAVIGRPNTKWGEEVAAYVVQRPGHRLEMNELDELCMAHIARFKRPRHYQLIDELPKNNYGKVLKTTLRALDAEQPH